jgi:hypothetical protein
MPSTKLGNCEMSDAAFKIIVERERDVSNKRNFHPIYRA